MEVLAVVGDILDIVCACCSGVPAYLKQVCKPSLLIILRMRF